MKWEKLAPLRTMVLALLGFAALTVGAFMLLPAVGWLVAGLLLVLFAYLTDTTGVSDGARR